ncbi:uncharacterized protein [Nicotiana tomentosiformis]|uniref:uncharacterized protein n=1 Tax=Nicotiana tomentosiformis TaxID=4098 RepID=UPI00388C7B13
MSSGGRGGQGLAGGKDCKGHKGAIRLKIGSWNIWTLIGKSIELTRFLQKMKVNIACVQEDRWVGTKAREADEFKLWYSGGMRGKNGVGILVDRELNELVVKVRRVNDRWMTIKLVIRWCTLNVISAYASQVGLDEEVKRRFWEGGDFNGHTGKTAEGYNEVHDGFNFGDRNEGGTSLLDLAKAFDLMIANSSFQKKEEHLVTFQSTTTRTQIDDLFLRRCDKGLCTNCKEKLLALGAWRSSGDASGIWMMTMNYTREATREVLGVLKGYVDGKYGDWWWNEDVQRKVEAKKMAYSKLVESTDEEEKRTNREGYKKDKKR